MGKQAVRNLFYSIGVLASVILALLTLMGAFSGHFVPGEYPFMALLGLALPGLMLVCLFVSVVWLWVRKRWAIPTGIALLGCWGYLSSVFQISFPSQGEEARYRLKVASYNVHHFGGEVTGYSCKEIARLMKQEKVDVICFQEMGGNRHFSTDSILRAFGDWPYAYLPVNDSLSSLPMGVFSKYPLMGERFIPYPESGNCSLMCDVLIGQDTVRLINNHLQTTSVNQNRNKWKRELETNDRKREVQAIESVAGVLLGNFDKRTEQTQFIGDLVRKSPYPVVVCGDFNSIPSSYTYGYLTDMLQDGFKEAGNGYMYTYRYAKHLLRIDYILHSSGLQCASYYSPDWDLCSDHNPVLCELYASR